MGYHFKMNGALDIKSKPYDAQNTKFSEDERRSLISEATSELLKFENGTSVINEISKFKVHRCPGINEGIFGCRQQRNNNTQPTIRSLCCHKGKIFLRGRRLLLNQSQRY